MRIAREVVHDPLPTALRLVLPFESRCRSRLSAMLDDGTPIGLVLARGTVLRGGDRLRCDDGALVLVVAADEPVVDAAATDARTLARVAYHLGNRHAALQVEPGYVRFAADSVLATLCERLGAQVAFRTAPFEPEAGAYAAGHHAHSGEARHSGIIHDMQERLRVQGKG